jgi:hypothetical protein
MYYGRLVDSRIHQATCVLASEQSTATLGTMKRLERLLGFVSGHRLGQIIFHESDMLLSVLSDASYLSRPRARSVAGSFHHLTRLLRAGLPPDPLAFINDPVFCHTNTIPVVCSSVQEAEYAAKRPSRPLV